MIRHLKSLFSTSSLGFRLGTTLVLALMPLGVLSIVQTQVAQDQMEATTLSGIGGASLQALQPQIDLIRESQSTVRVLAASLSAGVPADADCVALMRRVAEGIPEATVVAFIPASGQMTCASTGQAHDFADNPLFQKMLAADGPNLIFNPQGPVSGEAIIGVGHPVLDASGRKVGFVSVSLPHRALAPDAYADDAGLWHPALLATFTSDGTLLGASDEDEDAARLFPPGTEARDLALLAGRPFFREGSDGVRDIVSVTRVADDLYLVGLWERDAGVWGASALAPFLLPALTWAAALVAAALASGKLVVRHVRALARAMGDYMANRQRSDLPDIDEAPTEIRRLHAVYQELIGTIERDEADLQNLLVDKDVLLKEVHHRSGNSLQIIASVMRMYRRETQDENLRLVLDGLINRVIALSSTHTSLYSLSGQRDVPMDEILAGVTRRLKEIHGIPLGSARKSFQPIRMPVQAAIPLALALAEAVSCHFSSGEARAGGEEIILSEEAGTIRLRVSGPVVPELAAEPGPGLVSLPRRMLAQYAAQLRGTLSIAVEGNRSVVELALPAATV